MAQCIAPTRVLWWCSARDPATLSTCTVMVLLLPKKVVSFCYFSSKRNLNNLHSAFSLLLLVSKRMFPWMCLLLTDNIGSVFLIVDSLLLFVMCTVTLQRLRDSVTWIYTFIIIIIIIYVGQLKVRIKSYCPNIKTSTRPPAQLKSLAMKYCDAARYNTSTVFIVSWSKYSHYPALARPCLHGPHRETYIDRVIVDSMCWVNALLTLHSRVISSSHFDANNSTSLSSRRRIRATLRHVQSSPTLSRPHTVHKDGR